MNHGRYPEFVQRKSQKTNKTCPIQLKLVFGVYLREHVRWLCCNFWGHISYWDVFILTSNASKMHCKLRFYSYTYLVLSVRIPSRLWWEDGRNCRWHEASSPRSYMQSGWLVFTSAVRDGKVLVCGFLWYGDTRDQHEECFFCGLRQVSLSDIFPLFL